ncbi:Uncharacterized protein QTN25_005215 [Entamoeba marina]
MKGRLLFGNDELEETEVITLERIHKEESLVFGDNTGSMELDTLQTIPEVDVFRDANEKMKHVERRLEDILKKQYGRGKSDSSIHRSHVKEELDSSKTFSDFSMLKPKQSIFDNKSKPYRPNNKKYKNEPNKALHPKSKQSKFNQSNDRSQIVDVIDIEDTLSIHNHNEIGLKKSNAKENHVVKEDVVESVSVGNQVENVVEKSKKVDGNDIIDDSVGRDVAKNKEQLECQLKAYPNTVLPSEEPLGDAELNTIHLMNTIRMFEQKESSCVGVNDVLTVKKNVFADYISPSTTYGATIDEEFDPKPLIPTFLKWLTTLESILDSPMTPSSTITRTDLIIFLTEIRRLALDIVDWITKHQ